jgi:hypothetical protein
LNRKAKKFLGPELYYQTQEDELTESIMTQISEMEASLDETFRESISTEKALDLGDI